MASYLASSQNRASRAHLIEAPPLGRGRVGGRVKVIVTGLGGKHLGIIGLCADHLANARSILAKPSPITMLGEEWPPNH